MNAIPIILPTSKTVRLRLYICSIFGYFILSRFAKKESAKNRASKENLTGHLSRSVMLDVPSTFKVNSLLDSIDINIGDPPNYTSRFCITIIRILFIFCLLSSNTVLSGATIDDLNTGIRNPTELRLNSTFPQPVFYENSTLNETNDDGSENLYTLVIQGESGVSYAAIPYYTGFESGSLGSAWTATSSLPGVNIEVIETGTLTWSTETANSHTGNYFLGMDHGIGNAFNLNQADLHLNTLGESNLRLDFWWAEWNDETHAQDGIYISDDAGVSFTKILDFKGANYADVVWSHFDINLDSINTQHNLTYTDKYIIRFQQYDNFYFAGGNDGFLLDDITVQAAPEVNIKGNSVTILNGDTTPSIADHTDFGNQDISYGMVNRTFTIENTGVGVLNLTGDPKVVITGADASDFTVTIQPSTSVAATNGTTPFEIKFDPSTAGVKNATINIANNDLDERPYTFDVQGAGVCDLILTAGTKVNPTTCSGTDGSIPFTTNLADGTYSLSFTTTGATSPQNVTVNNGNFTLSGLSAGVYAAFSITTNGCTGNDASNINISDPASPTWYIDADGDDYGASSLTQCSRPTNGKLLGELAAGSNGTDDCNDADPNINPLATEICNGTDDNCNLQIDEGLSLAIVYVDSSATGANNGSSWANAYTDLQSALTLPRDSCGSEIWVAKGTYYPTNDNNRNTAITISDYDVEIYGGFNGSESTITERDWVNNPTILSGNIGAPQDMTDNSKTVVVITNVTRATRLDGFTIQDGYGGTGDNGRGGGLYAIGFQANTTPLIYNCKIINNRATNGGGVAVNGNNGSSLPEFVNCIVYGNSASGSGDGFYSFSRNSSPARVHLTHCTVINTISSNATISNSIVVEPDSVNTLLLGTHNVSHSIIQGDCTNCTDVQDVDPLFIDADNYNYQLQECSPAINAGIDTLSLEYDYYGNPRPLNNDYDIGAYEYQDILTTICYLDADGDGYGVDSLSILSCSSCQEGYVTDNTDCNDNSPLVHPNATEICDGIDNNCDGQIDEGLSNTIIYVDSAATGANTGASWTDAYTDLQDALGRSECENYQIWVAKGTYTPSTSESNQRNAFYGIGADGIEIYGGFLSGDMNIGDRDWKNNPTIISGDIGVKGDTSDNCYRIITVTGDDCKIDGIIIEHTNSLNLGPYSAQGGINVHTEERHDELPRVLSITNCEFRNNYTSYGSCISSHSIHSDIEVDIANCSFHDNYSALKGGAIYNRSDDNSTISSVNISASTFRNNSSGDYGGAIYNQSPSDHVAALTIQDCIFENNQSNISGGAIYNFSEGAIQNVKSGNVSGISSTIIRRSIFRYNSADQDGGAIWTGEPTETLQLKSSSNTDGGVQISNSLFHDNQADNGGAIYASETYPLIYNSTFTKNSAVTEGAVLYARKSVDANSPFGGSIDLEDPIFINSILWDNGPSPVLIDIDMGSPYLKNKNFNQFFITHSIYDDGNPDGSVNIFSAFDTGTDQAVRNKNNGINASIFSLSDYNPLFIDADNNDYRLQSCSPAVNTGYDLSNTTIVDINQDTLDLGLLPREYDDGTIDMGAYEVQEALTTSCYRDFDQDGSGNLDLSILGCLTCPQGYVLSDDDCNDIVETIYPSAIEICNGIDDDCDGLIDEGFATNIVENTNDDGCGSLRYVVRQAATGDTITFSPFINGTTIKLTSGEITLNKNLVIIGNDTTNTIIDAESTSRIFHVTRGDTVSISGIKMQGGNGEGEQLLFVNGERGGAILNQGHLGLTNCSLTANEAMNGGGFYNSEGDVTLTSTTLSENSAAEGGGGYNERGNINLINTTFSGNSASQGRGGGLFNNTNYKATLINTTFNDNFASFNGGGLYNSSYDISIHNCTFNGNSANNGGGIYNFEGNPKISNTTFSGNFAFNNGGGMNNWQASATLTNTTFSGNSTSAKGGGLFNGFLAEITLINSTLSGNSANEGGGLYIGEGDVTLTNSIIAKNTATNSGPDIENHATLIDGGHNLIGDGSGQTVITDDNNGNIVGADPLFITDVPAAPSAGGDLRLQACSPAINSGNNSKIPEDIYDLDGDMDITESIPYDLSDSTRVVGGVVDIGAYEYQDIFHTWYLDSDGDGYGNPQVTIDSCAAPIGYVSDMSDCDDNDADEYPGQTWYIDADGDNYGASYITTCERPANGFLITELSGSGTDDCADADANVNPSATEICNGIDDNCDGLIDEDIFSQASFDIVGSIEGPQVLCPALSVTYSSPTHPDITTYQWSYSGTGVEMNNTGSQLVIRTLSQFTSGTLSVRFYTDCGDTGEELSIDLVRASPVFCALADCAMENIFVDNELLDLEGSIDVYKADKAIQSNATLTASRNIIFQAGQSIEFFPNFQVSDSTVFISEIAHCID